MKPYTMWRIDDAEWMLEIEDEKLGDYVKDSIAQKPPLLKAERFGVGINIPLRVFKVKDVDIVEMETHLDKFLTRRKHG
jgi:hypothetical protein